MRNFLKFSLLCIILLISFILFGCSNYNNSGIKNKELIRMSNRHGSKIITVKDKGTIEKIKKIVKSITYTDENLKLNSTTENDYSIWLENNKSNKRIFSILIWLNNDKMTIFNETNSKYSYVKNSEYPQLRAILEKYVKNN